MKKTILILITVLLASCATPRTGTVELEVHADGPWTVRVFEHTTGDTASSTLHTGDGPQTIIYEQAAFVSANAHTDGVQLTAVDVMADGTRQTVSRGHFVYWWRVPPRQGSVSRFGEW